MLSLQERIDDRIKRGKENAIAEHPTGEPTNEDIFNATDHTAGHIPAGSEPEAKSLAPSADETEQGEGWGSGVDPKASGKKK
jgi:hypothetical protein